MSSYFSANCREELEGHVNCAKVFLEQHVKFGTPYTPGGGDTIDPCRLTRSLYMGGPKLCEMELAMHGNCVANQLERTQRMGEKYWTQGGEDRCLMTRANYEAPYLGFMQGVDRYTRLPVYPHRALLCFVVLLSADSHVLDDDASWRTTIAAAAETHAGEEISTSTSSPVDQTNEDHIPLVDVTFSTHPLSVAVRSSRRTGFTAHARMREGRGYRIVIADVKLGFPGFSPWDLYSLTNQEILDRADEPYSAHGVLVSAPERIPEESRRKYGGVAVYRSHVTAEYPGYYTIVFAVVRPFNIYDKPKFAIIRAQLE